MCSDLVYVILFPQLLIVVHFKVNNGFFFKKTTFLNFSAHSVGLVQHLRLPLRLHRGNVHKASRLYSTWVWQKKIKKCKHRPIVFQTGGENLIHLPPLIKYPMYDEDSKTQVRNISYYYYFARVFNQISALFPSSSRSALWPWWHQ